MASVLDVRVNYPDADPESARRVLRSAVQDLRDRGLSASAHWAMDILQNVPQGPSMAADGSPALRTMEVDESPEGGSSSTPARKGVQHQTPLSRSLFPKHSTPALGFEASPESERIDRFAPMRRAHLANQSHSVDGDDSPGGPSASSLAGTGSAHVRFAPSKVASTTTQSVSGYELDEALQDDAYAFAKSFFDQHQFERCAALLEKQGRRSNKADFLRLYSKYLVSERHRDEFGVIVPLPSGKLPSASPDLVAILQDLIDPTDPFLLYLKGIIFRKLHKRVEAMDCFIRSVQMCPYNWGAWQELSATLDNETGELEAIAYLLPDTFMVSFFHEYNDRKASVMHGDNLERIDSLLHLFPNSIYLLGNKAAYLNSQMEIEDSCKLFEHVFEADPWRLEFLAEYSNVLYVLDKREKLAELAHRFAEVGRDVPGVCILIGNYFNSRSDHIQAIEAYKRAARLDSSYVWAFILLGHEYVEMSNLHAATEMYRRAIEIEPKSYHAWHGLGKVYELQNAFTFALHYYEKCVGLRPYDHRGWASIATTFEKLKRTRDAIACYKRHLTCARAPVDKIMSMERIIDLYEEDGSLSQALSWHVRLVQLAERSQSVMSSSTSPNAAFARSYVLVAKAQMGEYPPPPDEDLQAIGGTKASGVKDARKTPKLGNLALANEYLQKVTQMHTSEYTEEAEELLKKLAFMRD